MADGTCVGTAVGYAGGQDDDYGDGVVVGANVDGVKGYGNDVWLCLEYVDWRMDAGGEVCLLNGLDVRDGGGDETWEGFVGAWGDA